MISIYLIDDHQFIIDGVSRIVEQHNDIQIIGSETNPLSAVETLKTLDTPIDVVICDLSMPDMTGDEVLKEVRRERPETNFLILTMHDDPDHVLQIADAGAEGYALKSGDPNSFIDAIRRIAGGGTYYSSEVIHHLFTASKKQTEIAETIKRFTEREIEILKLVLQEKTSHEIAEELFISKQTVDTHRKNILQKSGESNLIGLVKFGLRNGLIDIE